MSAWRAIQTAMLVDPAVRRLFEEVGSAALHSKSMLELATYARDSWARVVAELEELQKKEGG